MKKATILVFIMLNIIFINFGKSQEIKRLESLAYGDYNYQEIRKMLNYPPEMTEIGMQGKVIAKILIDEEGHYVKHEILRSPHKQFTVVVEKALPHLQCKPILKNDKAVSDWVIIPFEFRLGR